MPHAHRSFGPGYGAIYAEGHTPDDRILESEELYGLDDLDEDGELFEGIGDEVAASFGGAGFGAEDDDLDDDDLDDEDLDDEDYGFGGYAAFDGIGSSIAEEFGYAGGHTPDDNILNAEFDYGDEEEDFGFATFDALGDTIAAEYGGSGFAGSGFAGAGFGADPLDLDEAELKELHAKRRELARRCHNALKADPPDMATFRRCRAALAQVLADLKDREADQASYGAQDDDGDEDEDALPEEKGHGILSGLPKWLVPAGGGAAGGALLTAFLYELNKKRKKRRGTYGAQAKPVNRNKALRELERLTDIEEDLLEDLADASGRQEKKLQDKLARLIGRKEAIMASLGIPDIDEPVDQAVFGATSPRFKRRMQSGLNSAASFAQSRGRTGLATALNRQAQAVGQRRISQIGDYRASLAGYDPVASGTRLPSGYAPMDPMTGSYQTAGLYSETGGAPTTGFGPVYPDPYAQADPFAPDPFADDWMYG